MFYNKCEKNSEKIAAECLKKGGIAILPTDTIYGISGIAEKKIEKKIYNIKERSEKKPLIRLVSNPEDAQKSSIIQIPLVLKSFWPGALTIILPCENGNLAFRCPGDEWIRKVIFLCGCPIFSTSVNKSGKKNLEKISQIKKEFSKVDLIIDAGDFLDSKPSTIVQVEISGKIKILREGALKINL